MIYPLPAVLVSCGATPEEYNLFTAAWTGTICSDPALCYVSIRQERHSHDIIERNMAFTINLTNEELARATDWCGVRSGRDFNKWKEMGLTPVKGVKVAAPYIDEAPVSIECLALIKSISNGLTNRISATVAFKFSAAVIAVCTIEPKAKMAILSPCRLITPLPIATVSRLSEISAPHPVPLG